MSLAVSRRILLSFTAIGIPLGYLETGACAITYRTVALSGQSAPGITDGAVFAGFNRSPVLNRNGHVAFTASFTGPNGNENGIWSEGAGSLALIARKNLPAPGTDVSYSNVFLDPLISNGGQTAFAAVLSGPGVTNSNRVGFWSDASGSLQLVARDGSPAPNVADATYYTPFGLEFAGLFNSSPGIDDAGRTAFFANLSGPTVDSTNDETIWSEREGSLNVVAREGSAASVMAENAEWGILGEVVLVNGIGQIAFGARIGPNFETGTVSIWTELDGVFRRVVSEGLPAPGTPNGTTFGTFWNLSLNNAGDTAIVAELDDGPDLNTTNGFRRLGGTSWKPSPRRTGRRQSAWRRRCGFSAVLF